MPRCEECGYLGWLTETPCGWMVCDASDDRNHGCQAIWGWEAPKTGCCIKTMKDGTRYMVHDC